MGKLELRIVQARNVQDKDTFSKSDPYCQVSCEGKKYKTKTKKNNLNPMWDETFMFMVANTATAQLKFELFDDDWGKDPSLGHCTLPVNSLFKGVVFEQWMRKASQNNQDRDNQADMHRHRQVTHNKEVKHHLDTHSLHKAVKHQLVTHSLDNSKRQGDTLDRTRPLQATLSRDKHHPATLNRDKHRPVTLNKDKHLLATLNKDKHRPATRKPMRVTLVKHRPNSNHRRDTLNRTQATPSPTLGTLHLTKRLH
eukprot:gene10145-15599_t